MLLAIASTNPKALLAALCGEFACCFWLCAWLIDCKWPVDSLLATRHVLLFKADCSHYGDNYCSGP